jgi:hypothetical protein
MLVRRANPQHLPGSHEIEFEAKEGVIGCTDCARHKTFTIPHSLTNEFREGNVVIFAGAGISTESRDVLSWTLYDEVRSATKSTVDAPFADLMTAFTQRPNSRLELMRLIRERVEYVQSFPELYDEAVRFHRALGTLPYVTTIITTNWDPFFERECHATPFVFPEDLAFWEAADRKVLKIHGTIENLGSMIVTRDDYNRSLSALQTGQVGAFLKAICANKTIVFAGYSVRDEDFVAILRAISTAMGDYRKLYYAVTIDESEATVERFRALNIVPIFTDATFFVTNV